LYKSIDLLQVHDDARAACHLAQAPIAEAAALDRKLVQEPALGVVRFAFLLVTHR
jgi:hypothetical protein